MGRRNVCEIVYGGPRSSLANDEDFLTAQVKYVRQSASPSAAIAIDRMWFETDARPIVRSLGVPSLVLWRREAVYAAESRYLAEHVPGTIAVELPGSDHLPGSETSTGRSTRSRHSSVR